MNQSPLQSPLPLLPHHKLLAYAVARDLVVAVRAASIRSPHLRDQALRAAQPRRGLSAAQPRARRRRLRRAAMDDLGRRAAPVERWCE